MGARSTHVISCPAMPACYWLIRIKRRSAWPVVSSWGCFSQENQSTRSHCLHRAESAGLRQYKRGVLELQCVQHCDEYYKSGQHSHRTVLTCETTTREANRLYSVGFRKYNKSGQHIVQCFAQCWLLMEEEQQSTCGESGWTSGPPTCLSISPTNIPIVFLGKICSK